MFMSQAAMTRSVCVLLSVLLSACSQTDMADLEGFVAEVNARKNPEVKQIPEFKVMPSFFYEPGTRRDPFKALLDKTDEPNVKDDATKLICNRPDPNRVRVGLELLPLDSISMVGTLQDESKILWGLVIAKGDGTIYRVKTGDYLGDEYGRITSISEDKIEVLNLISDNAGCFIDKQASLALSSEPTK